MRAEERHAIAAAKNRSVSILDAGQQPARLAQVADHANRTLEVRGLSRLGGGDLSLLAAWPTLPCSKGRGQEPYSPCLSRTGRLHHQHRTWWPSPSMPVPSSMRMRVAAMRGDSPGTGTGQDAPPQRISRCKCAGDGREHPTQAAALTRSQGGEEPIGSPSAERHGGER